MSVKNIDVYWSFRSPYSYLAMPQLDSLRNDFSVSVTIKPVFPLAVREISFFENRRPQQFTYFLKDMMREAAKLGVPLRWPSPDPVVQDPNTMKVAEEQPYLGQLLPLGAAAQKLKGAEAFDFFYEISKIIFDGNTDNWHEGDHLSDAAKRGGVELPALEQMVLDDEAGLLALIEQNEKEQQAYHWGVPLMVYNGEPFFGQDRISTLRWVLEQE